MSRIYICSVSSDFPENYRIGLIAGKWGVEEKYASKVQGVRAGDRLLFVVGGAFRSLHTIISDPYEERQVLWPPKKGDVYPIRFDIGPAEATGNVPVRDLAARISFMRGKVWGGTLQGPNEESYRPLVHGLTNIRTIGFELQVRLRG